MTRDELLQTSVSFGLKPHYLGVDNQFEIGRVSLVYKKAKGRNRNKILLKRVALFKKEINRIKPMGIDLVISVGESI